MTSIRMARATGPELTLWGEPTRAPGLFIVPATTTAGGTEPIRYDGGWRVVHITGRVLSRYALTDLDNARTLAARLADVCADWTDLSEHTREWPPTLRADVAATITGYLDELVSEQACLFGGPPMGAGDA